MKALLRRSPMDGDNLAVVEGPKLVGEALSSGLDVEEIFVAASKLSGFSSEEWVRRIQGRLLCVSDRLLHTLSDTVTSQGILATVRVPAAPLEPLLRGHPLLLIAHQIQDPGNLGTIIRSAEAFGVGALLLTTRTVSPLNPKAVRASAGSLFRLPIAAQLTPEGLASSLHLRKIRLMAAMPGGRIDFRQANYHGGLAIVVGSEGQGVPAGLGAFDAQIGVPTAGGVESLNVAAATAIILCEASRQRASHLGASP